MLATATPMDDELAQLNRELASTVVAYGRADERREAEEKVGGRCRASAPAAADRLAYLLKAGEGSVVTGARFWSTRRPRAGRWRRSRPRRCPSRCARYPQGPAAGVRRRPACEAQASSRADRPEDRRARRLPGEGERRGGARKAGGAFDQKVNDAIRAQAAKKGIRLLDGAGSDPFARCGASLRGGESEPVREPGSGFFAFPRRSRPLSPRSTGNGSRAVEPCAPLGRLGMRVTARFSGSSCLTRCSRSALGWRPRQGGDEGHGPQLARLERIDAMLEGYVDAERIPSAIALVARRGRIAHVSVRGQGVRVARPDAARHDLPDLLDDQADHERRGAGALRRVSSASTDPSRSQIPGSQSRKSWRIRTVRSSTDPSPASQRARSADPLLGARLQLLEQPAPLAKAYDEAFPLEAHARSPRGSRMRGSASCRSPMRRARSGTTRVSTDVLRCAGRARRIAACHSPSSSRSACSPRSA